MSLKTIPQSLIDSVIDVATKSEETRSRTMQRIVSEGLKHFGVSSMLELSEGDQKAFHAWTQLRLAEDSCSCGGTNKGSCTCKDNLVEDDMPGDSTYHKDGDEDAEKKSTLDEDSSIDYECADCDSRGRRTTDALNDRHNRDLRYTEYLGLKKLPLQTLAQKKRMDVLKTLRVSDNKAAMSESAAMTDKQKFSALRNINHVEVRRGSAGKDRMDISLYYMGKKLASMDSPMNSSSRRPELIWITPEGDDLLKKQGILKENVALGADEIATNGAVAVGDASVATPKHADVLRDTDPHTGVSQYRLLLQYATNEGTKIYPPVSLPGAASVADLRTLVQGLPEFNDEVENALTVAGMLGE